MYRKLKLLLSSHNNNYRKMSDSPTNLYPLKILTQGEPWESMTLFFHTPHNDKIYQLKDKGRQQRFQISGNFRTLYLDEDELIEKGYLKQFRSKDFTIYFL